MSCPDDDELAQLVSGSLEPARRAAIANHAATCATCRAVVDALLGATSGQDTRPTAAEDEPDAPRRLGRYVLERRIGSGGMGVVWAAHDPELGRRVAVKLLRPGGGAERLRREAMALARLSHPNVVAVHDVGTHDGQTFVAMALIDGDNLRQWLRTPRPQAEILAALTQAGRGVIAAHEAGLVHRDLKPDNIFIGRGGEVLVGDFGLARDHGSSDGGDDDAGALATAATALTMTGAVVGTPSYMAPEQADGEASFASDQFSFCVTAWEALYGVRPFQADGIAALREAIARGAIQDPPADRKVPARIERALRRGLAVDPAARFPSLRDLLAALAPPRRRWPYAAAALALAGALIGGVALARRTEPSPAARCAGTERLLDATWSPARRAAVEQALATAQAPAALVGAATAAVDRYAAAWIDLRRDACLATHVRRERRPDSLERTARCLDRRAATLAGAVDAIIRGGTEPAAAWLMLDQLEPVEGCRDPAGTAQDVAPSVAAEALRRELAALDLRNRAVDSGLQGVDVAALTARAIAAGDPIATIAALTLEGRVAMERAHHGDAEAALRRAVGQADAAGDDLGRARAAALLTEALVRTGRLDEASAQLDATEAALTRAGGDPVVAVDVDNARALLAAARGDTAGAVAARRAAVERLRAVHGDDSLLVALAYHSLGLAHQTHGDLAAARAAHEAADVIHRRVLAQPDGDNLVEAALNQANAAMYDGNFGRLIAGTEHALALARLHAPGTATEVMVIGALAQAYDLAGDQAAAARSYAAAVAAADALGDAFTDRGIVLDWMISAGDSLRGSRQPAASLAWYRRALATADAIGAGAARGAELARRGLGRSLVLLGEYDQALPLVRAALAVAERETPMRPFPVGALSFALAEALWATGGDRDREHARALVGDAERLLARAIDETRQNPMQAGLTLRIENELARLRAWQRAHP